jgi:MoaA/NifB/PqqE/SkfB family radical SAM enzyme
MNHAQKVFWMQPENTQIGKWQNQIAELTGSKSFCVLPWIHVATRPNGDMRICCVANASGADSGDYQVGLVKMEDGEPANFGQDLPTEAFNNTFMKSVRKTMLAGEVPASCLKCYKEEEQGIASKRIWETGTWHLEEKIDIPELIDSTEQDGSIPYKLQYLDLRLGHTCNLKCVMCSPHDSSLWVPEHKKVYPLFKSPVIQKLKSWDQNVFDNRWHENPAFWREIYDQIPNLKQLYFAGGEPLLIKEHHEFLKEIVKQGHAKNISLRYNTNGTLLNEELISIWSEFKKVKISISLDGIGPKVEYIRFPAVWETIEKNIWRLEDTPDNIETNIAAAVQILNIKHIPDFIKWKVSSGFKKLGFDRNAAGHLMGGGLMGVHLVWIPTWMSIRVLPKEDKEEVRRLFAELKDWLWNNYTQDIEFWENNPYGWKRWEGILDWMDDKDHTNLLPEFREYTTVLEQERGTDFKKTFPELSHLLD